jgi:hypothetical protein
MPGRRLIAIVGSLDSARQYSPPLRGLDIARRACEQIGSELAAQGCDLVVFSSDAAFVEADAVSGYVASGKAESGSIQVRSRLGRADGQFQQMAEHDELFDVRGDPSSDWEVSYYRSLVEVQGIILIGGERSTLATGLIALAFHVPVVAVATFGGGTEKVWGALERTRSEATAEEISAMAQPWHKESAARLVRSLVEQGRRKEARLAENQRAERRQSRRVFVSLVVTALLLVAGLGTIPLMYSWKPGTSGSLLLLCVGPLFLATSGAIVRNIFDQGREWLRPAVLGLSAGAISFLLFVAAQLASNPDALDGPGARRLLFFVLPLGFIAGLTFDAVYAKLRTVDVTQTDILKQQEKR